MPRITLSAIAAATLLSTFVAGNTALAQANGVSPLEVPSTAVLPSSDPIGANSPLADRLPLRLVKRSGEARRSTASERYGKPIELPPPKQSRSGDKRQPLTRQSATTGNVTSVVLSSLAIVLGLFFLVVWLARRSLPKSATSLPSDVLEVLGRSPLANRHNLQLIRLGRRLLLVSVTPDTAETLTEITDPDEVNHLVGLCQQERPESITSSFRQVLHQLGSQRPQQPAASRRSRKTSTTLDTEIGTDITGGNATGARSSLRHMRELS